MNENFPLGRDADEMAMSADPRSLKDRLLDLVRQLSASGKPSKEIFSEEERKPFSQDDELL